MSPIPDHRCLIHGELKAASKGRDGYVRYYCNACRREKSGRPPRYSDRCRHGHLKTPWTYRLNKSTGFYRCMTCEYDRRRERRRKAA